MPNKKKRSGLSASRALKLENLLIGRVQEIFLTGIHLQQTHAEMSVKVVERIYRSKEWKSVPLYVRAYVEGYLKARRDEMYRHYVEWRMSLDGKLLTRAEVDVQCIAEGTANTDKSPWARIDSDKSSFCWKGTAKPY